MKTFITYNFGALLWMGLILVLLLLPTIGVEQAGVSSLDKFIHIGMFGMLCYLCITGLVKQFRFSQRKHRIAPYCLLFTILFGIITEFIQYELKYRSFDPWDMAADALGALCGFAYFQFWISKCLKSAYNFNI